MKNLDRGFWSKKLQLDLYFVERKSFHGEQIIEYGMILLHKYQVE